MLNIEKIFTLIAARPQIRTVEIADLIDCEPEQVQPALQPHVDCGNLTLIEVTAPNGRPANGFMVTRKFMDGELYQVLLPSINEQRTADERVRPAQPPAPALVAPRPPEKSMTAPGVQRAVPPRLIAADPAPEPVAEVISSAILPAAPTKVQLALDFLAVNGPSTAAQMRRPMGLQPHHFASNFFQTALIDGRIVKNGNLYMLPAQRTSSPVAVVEPDIAPSAPAATPIVVAAAADEAPAAAKPAQMPSPAFRCARWSDGVIDLYRDGVVVMTLTPAECAMLAPSVALTMAEVAK